MKEINNQTNWCVKLTKDNINIINDFLINNKNQYPNYKESWRFVTSDINNDYYFCFPETETECYATTKPANDYALITNEEFLLKIKGIEIIRDKTYPTNLNTVKFSSEPDKCVGKRPHYVYMCGCDPINIPDNFGIMGATQKSVDAFEDSRRTVDEKITNSRSKVVYWDTGGDVDNKNAMSLFIDAYKDKLTIENPVEYKWNIMQFPLTPKDCYAALPDMIYVKKLKTFLKNG
jgi:hypothetical protein